MSTVAFLWSCLDCWETLIFYYKLIADLGKYYLYDCFSFHQSLPSTMPCTCSVPTEYLLHEKENEYMCIKQKSF